MTPPARKAYFARPAEGEFRVIRKHYADEAKDIAEAFHAEVTRAVAFIERFPEAAPISIGNLRRKTLRKPFDTLFYAIEPDRIRIAAVAHHRREPSYFIPHAT